MKDETPKILILDNDETTGSYYLLFSLYDLLALSNFGKHLDSKKTMRIILHFCISSGIFRPYLLEFLYQVKCLKDAKLLDKVCIYTNQLDTRDVYHHPLWITSDKKKWSVPEMIRVMFNMITDDDTFIDKVYTRPILKQNVDYPVKDFTRVFEDLYPNRKVDLSKTVFIDDLYMKKYIIDSSKSGTDKNSRWAIPAYKISLPQTTLIDLISTIIKENNITVYDHNSILRNTVETSWLYINNNLKNKNTKSKVLLKLAKKLKNVYKAKPTIGTRKNVKRTTKKDSKNKGRKTKRGNGYSSKTKRNRD